MFLSLVCRRVIHMVVTLILLTLLTFFLLNLSPVDPVEMQLLRQGVAPDPSLIASMREQYGLDQPVYIQYIRWLLGLFHGDFGYSLAFSQPVSVLVGSAIPKTAALAFSSLLLSILVTVPLAFAAFHYYRRLPDLVIRILTFVGLAIPTFWLSLLLIYFFAVKLQLLPVNARGAQGMILPTVALSVWMCGRYIRRLRGALLEEYRKNYILGARTLGLPRSMIWRKYLLPNALPGVISMLGLTMGNILGGSAVIETIFGWRGMGELMVDAILNNDYILMQSYILWGAGIFILVNLISDLLCLYLSPEAREKGGLS